MTAVKLRNSRSAVCRNSADSEDLVYMDFKQQYAMYLAETERRIDEYFTNGSLPQENVRKAMRYAVCAGGKRIRPVLLSAVCDMLGGDAEDASRVALAVECVHNYSLIHDDLPCMDNDDLRRGRPTCHKVFEENIALLAGDGLLNTAFEILSDRDKFKTLTSDCLLSIIQTLSTAAGVFGMIGGQVVDLESEGRSGVGLDELLYMHRHKTGALIRAAAVCGCLCAGLGVSDKKTLNIAEFSSKLGLAFQIKDDILDVTGSEEVLGKPIGSDEESGKNTFVSLLGIDGAKQYLANVTAEAKTALEPFGGKARFLNELADYLFDRSY